MHSDGNTLREITVLHVYRPGKLNSDGELALFGFWCHPNPAALDDKLAELSAIWTVERVTYVRADRLAAAHRRIAELESDRARLDNLLAQAYRSA